MERLRFLSFIAYNIHMAGLKEGVRNTAMEAVLIYINQDQLDEVKYLLEQSAIGNHILFDHGTIKRIAYRIGTDEVRDDRVTKAESLLEQLIQRPSISSKKAFLEKLDLDTHDDVARVYFNIVQNGARKNQNYCH